MEFCMQHWFVSDLHFYHKKICQYANRPFDNVDDMNEALIRNWNAKVAPDDIIYSLGDFGFGKIGFLIEVISQLNGNIYMITGNHDEEIIKNKQHLLDMQLVKEVTPYKEITVNGQFIVLFHYGARTWNRGHRGSWQLFGHSHNSLPPYGKSVDVGVDATSVLNGRTEYRPLSFHEIKHFMDKQKQVVADYHGDTK